MTDPDLLLDDVTGSFDALHAAGDPYDGLLPSILDRDSGEMYREIPGEIQAQRSGDRSYLGSNLLYDVPLLHALFGVAAADGDERHAETADRYVTEFVTRCTDTASGLFPWGDHAYWHLAEDRIGNSSEYRLHNSPDRDDPVHDHFRKVPPWLWERLHDVDPDCVQQFADGLDYHWVSEIRDAFDRHAFITRREYQKWDPEHAGCDFPRYTGLYAIDLAMAYTYEGRPATRRQIERFLDYWWDKRTALDWWDDERVLPVESYGRSRERARGQTRSLAVSLLEAATILDDVAPDLAATARVRGETYLHGVLDVGASDDGDPGSETLWGGGGPYGGTPPAVVGLQYLAAWRCRGDERALARAREVGRRYLDAEPPADGVMPFEASGITLERGTSSHVDVDQPVPMSADDAGVVVELLADLYDVTGDEQFRDRGLELAGTFREVFFDDAPLPRGAAGIDWYESELGTGTLLHGLARIALLARDGTDPIGPNYVHTG